MQHMGPFERDVEFLRGVPKRERAALRAYIDTKDVQQQPIPIAPRVVIDVHDSLETAGLLDAEPSKQLRWLKQQFPKLVDEMERQRADGVTSSNRDAWWLFHRPRPDLRSAWTGLARVLLIGRHVKVLSPVSVPLIDPEHDLRLCPSDSLVVVVAESLALAAVLTSFPFELHVRRSCSTIKSDLRVTPSEAFPTFPLPWPATWSNDRLRPVALPAPSGTEDLLGKPMAAIVALRNSILVGKERAKIPAEQQPGGPTDLYNLYDNPNITLDAIAKLRALHVELTDAVLRSYGWHQDGADGPALRLSWIFDRPWIDGTNRYVPDIAGRREIVVRLAKRNARRFEEELDLCLTHLPALIATDGLAETGIDKWRKDKRIGLSKEEVLAMFDRGVSVGRVKAVQRKGKRWWGLAR